jgi:GNAT superfamily N-acetyltransferase
MVMFFDRGIRLLKNGGVCRLGLVVRPFQVGDIEALVELMGHLGYPTAVEQMRSRMEVIQLNPCFRTLVAECDGTVVGMIGMSSVPQYEADGIMVQVNVIVVHPEHRGRGVATALMGVADEWAREIGAGGVFLTSGLRPERASAHRLYRRLGFDITGYRFVKKFGERKA